ncbi:MAG: ligand-binding sensor domain-containing protein [Arenicella sp.]|jgi:ligand-binding sensor domain-containing protein
MSVKQTFLLTFIFSIMVSFAFSQTPHFRTYTLQDGLPQTSTHDLLLDDKARIWVGTQGGVARFDGKKFRTYTQIHGLGTEIK